ncbi:hypothetical protein Dimus_031090 [Dionaea muscipula]
MLRKLFRDARCSAKLRTYRENVEHGMFLGTATTLVIAGGFEVNFKEQVTSQVSPVLLKFIMSTVGNGRENDDHDHYSNCFIMSLGSSDCVLGLLLALVEGKFLMTCLSCLTVSFVFDALLIEL